MDNNNKPYANLEPHVMLDAIESLGLKCTGSLLSLNSYENRVVQVGMEESPPLIAKFYRPERWSDATILEEHQFATELVAQEIPIVAPIIINDQSLHHYQNFRFALFHKHGSRAVELDSLEHLEMLGRLIGRLHSIGSCRGFVARPQINLQTYGHDPYQFLLKNDFIPDHFKQAYSTTVESVLQKIQLLFEQFSPLKQIRLHGDCHAGNVLWDGANLKMVDFDDCLTGPAIQDIWMLLSGDESQIARQLDKILCGYEDFYEFNYRELKLVEAFRTLRLLHYSAWLAKRWEDPAFPANFPWFGTTNYWQEQIHNLREQDILLEHVLAL